MLYSIYFPFLVQCFFFLSFTTLLFVCVLFFPLSYFVLVHYVVHYVLTFVLYLFVNVFVSFFICFVHLFIFCFFHSLFLYFVLSFVCVVFHPSLFIFRFVR